MVAHYSTASLAAPRTTDDFGRPGGTSPAPLSDPLLMPVPGGRPCRAPLPWLSLVPLLPDLHASLTEVRRQLPVLIVYWTVSVGASGEGALRPDVYDDYTWPRFEALVRQRGRFLAVQPSHGGRRMLCHVRG